MPVQPKPIPEEKDELHPRNKHRGRYNFPELIAACPELANYVSKKVSALLLLFYVLVDTTPNGL